MAAPKLMVIHLRVGLGVGKKAEERGGAPSRDALHPHSQRETVALALASHLSMVGAPSREREWPQRGRTFKRRAAPSLPVRESGFGLGLGLASECGSGFPSPQSPSTPVPSPQLQV